MNLRFSAVVSLIGLAACSNSNEPVRDPSWETGAANPNVEMTPASREGNGADQSHDSTSALAPHPVSPSPEPESRGTGNTLAPSAPRADEPIPSGEVSKDGRSAAPDNTKVNERDRSSAAPTPTDQGNGESDLKITQQIRQAVMADDSLSFTAKNVKIITQGGKVTLRGPVTTAQERSAIEAAARKVVGANVDNQIEVKK